MELKLSIWETLEQNQLEKQLIVKQQPRDEIYFIIMASVHVWKEKKAAWFSLFDFWPMQTKKSHIVN